MELETYLDEITMKENRLVYKEILDWVQTTFPALHIEMKWNQPMFINHGTFIISFTASKKHISVAPEKVFLEEFLDEIVSAGYSHSKMIFRIKYTDQVDYVLLKRIIERIIDSKKDYDKFWL